MNKPLNGIRILDLSRLVPGAYLTQLLVDLGADVIKVETPTLGDYARFIPSEMELGNMFEMINQGKRSVAINYRHPSGRDVFLKLARTADVVLESLSTGNG
jgi:crotonobetainyl-CoA:carnitine CoA-transferase CaiB-like acyl-CoA transferase